MKINKYLTLLGAAVGALVVSSGASALTPDGNNIITDTGTLTVTNLAESSDQLRYFKIVDAKLINNEIKFAFTNDFQGYLTNAGNSLTIEQYQAYTSGDITSGDMVPAASALPIDQLIAGYVASKGGGAYGTAMTVSGTTATATVPAGAYVIAPSSSTHVYSLMLGNIGIKTENGQYVIDQSAAVGSTIVAKTGDPAVIQKSTNDSDYNIGDTITYTLDVSIPVYPVDTVNRRFVITDSMYMNYAGVTEQRQAGGVVIDQVTGMSSAAGTINYYLNNGNIYDYNGGTLLGTYAIDNNNDLTVILTDASSFGTDLHITYTAHLNGNATIGSNKGNYNNVRLDYPEDPYNSNGTKSTYDDAVVYSYGIKIVKTGENSTPLQNVEFQVKNAQGVVQTCYSGVNNTALSPVTTDSNGIIYCRGLAEGTYTIHEVAPPAGYAAIADQTVTITAATATIAGPSGSNYGSGYVEKSIVNTKTNFNLPFTGGRGVIVYAILGVGIVSIASVYYYRKKKNEA